MACHYFSSNDILGDCTPPQGFCDETIAKCICAEGYSGLGDFINGEGKDCNLYLPLIRNLWLLVAIAHLIFMCWFTQVALAYRNLKGHDALLQHRQLRGFFPTYVIAPLKISEGVMKFTRSAMIGTSRTVSMAHSVSGMWWWGWVAPIIISEWLKIVISQARFKGVEGKRMAELLEMSGQRLFLHRMVCFVTYFSTFMMWCFRGNIKAQQALSVVYYVGHLVMSCWLFNHVALPVLRNIHQLLANNMSGSPEINKKRKKLGIFIKITTFLNRVVNFMGLCFACLPYLYNFASYIVVLVWMFAIGLQFATLWLVKPSTRRTKNQREQNLPKKTRFLKRGSTKEPPAVEIPDMKGSIKSSLV